jgi:transposase-like protein
VAEGMEQGVSVAMVARKHGISSGQFYAWRQQLMLRGALDAGADSVPDLARLAKLIQSSDERLTDYLARLDRADAEEHTTSKQRAARLSEKIAALKERRACHTALLQELERTGESQISLTDPDSRAMAAHPKVGVGDNVQVAVDARHKLIVEQQVTNAGSDLGLLATTAAVAKEVLGVDNIDAVADKGYYKGEDIQACEDAGISTYVARPQRGSVVRDGLFRKEEFHYDAASDTFICPGGATLEPRYRSVVGGHSTLHYCNRDACRSCEIKPRCTSNTYRRIIRWAEEAVLDRMSERVAARPEVFRLRRETVEHPFGSIKQWMNQGYFLMPGLEKVRAEFSLTALAHNLRRALNLVGFTELVGAVQG